MSLKDDVLKEFLTADDYISGEELAKKFGKSRAAVWKAVKVLSKDGYNIDAVTNKGYKLTEDNNIISKQTIETHLKNENVEVIYYPSIDSTNNECKRMLASGKNNIFLIAADEQTAGRGRQGKSFYSPKMTGIYFSVALHPNTRLQNAVTITTATAVAVCKAIEFLTDKKPQIKWVNDVYLNKSKICGILTEAITDFETSTVQSIVVGIGMNIKTTQFPDDILNAGCLDCNVNRSELIAQITKELLKIVDGDYKSFIDYYRSHSMIIGKKINFIQNGTITPATAVAIDEAGGLEIELGDGSHTVLRSGEISIIPKGL